MASSNIGRQKGHATNIICVQTPRASWSNIDRLIPVMAAAKTHFRRRRRMFPLAFFYSDVTSIGIIMLSLLGSDAESHSYVTNASPIIINF